MSLKDSKYFNYALQYVFNSVTGEWEPLTSGSSDPSAVKVVDNSDYGDIQRDAWGRPKAILDYSLFHGTWTFGVRDSIWEEYEVSGGSYTPLAQTGTYAVSSNGLLKVGSGTVASEGGYLRSKRNPRYQPNRGHLYSTAVILASPTADGRRKWGLFTEENGVYFELEGDGADWQMYACRLTDGVVELRINITSMLPSGFDPSKGHVYDIQYQWRGVGNYKFFVDLQEVYLEAELGTRTTLSMRNPALPVAFESITDDAGVEVTIEAGCVDVASEGGQQEGRSFVSQSTEGLVDVDDANSGSAALAIRVPRTVTLGSEVLLNSIDAVASRLGTWCRDEAGVYVYVARDTIATNLAGLTWTNRPDANLSYIIGGHNTTLDVAFQLDRGNMQKVLEEWNDIEVKNVITNPAEDTAPFWITPGDILVVVIEPWSGTKEANCTIYLSEEF